MIQFFRPIVGVCVLFLIFSSCSSTQNPSDSNQSNNELENENPEVKEEVEILYSFAFVGCNRVQRGDQKDSIGPNAATNTTSANLAALKRIFDGLCQEERKPELFFFLGDLVYAESTLPLLNRQLEAWVKQYKDTSFSKIRKSVSGIEMVAVPGNHEMLTWVDHNVPAHDEWPLKGATDIWMHYMSPYMPPDRDIIGGVDSLNNRMTFSFTRENVGFIVMNTDTYNDSTMYGIQNVGMEGFVPTNWILDKVRAYKKDTSIHHVFVLGHKPYYVDGDTNVGHGGLPEGPVLWPILNETNTIAMLSAHQHDYQRMQPGDMGTYQIIAGNAGSEGAATFFGYSTINILSNGDVQLISKGYDKGAPYTKAMPNSPLSVRDSTILTWTKNASPYPNNF